MNMRKSIIAVFLLAATPAAAQNINLTLKPEELVAIVRSMDRQPISEPPPAGFWDAQAKVLQALQANPEAWREVRAALDRHYQAR
jgi:hypothetical protein